MSKGMDVLAVAAQKGGVGKTTTTIYTANYAAQALGSTVERPLVGIVDRRRCSTAAALCTAISTGEGDRSTMRPLSLIP